MANLHVFSQLVHAAVYELGIHNPFAKPKMMALCVYMEEKENAPTPGQSLEERRAVLASFLITSMYSLLSCSTSAADLQNLDFRAENGLVALDPFHGRLPAPSGGGAGMHQR
jgi:hypothetical protein